MSRALTTTVRYRNLYGKGSPILLELRNWAVPIPAVGENVQLENRNNWYVVRNVVHIPTKFKVRMLDVPEKCEWDEDALCVDIYLTPEFSYRESSWDPYS